MPALPLTVDPDALFLTGLLLKGTVLLAGVYAVTLALRRASAAMRHLVWAGGITMLLVLPVFTEAVPWRLPVLALDAPAPALADGPLETDAPSAGDRTPAAADEPQLADAPVAVDGSVEADAPAVTDGSQDADARSDRSSRIDPITAAFLVWGAGALLILARLGLGALAVRRVIRAGTVADGAAWTRPLYEAADRLGLAEAPALVISPAARMPFAAGPVRPVIALPTAAHSWTDRRRRAVLSHELAHIRRRDLAVNLVAQLACAAWWFHPLAWISARRLRLESERACDDLVLGIGTRPSEYADHLLQIVCRAANARTPALALPMAQRREFEGRMLAILAPAAPRGQPGRLHATFAAAAALAFTLPLSALGTRTGEPPASEPVTMPAIDSALGAEPSAADRDSELGARPSAGDRDFAETDSVLPAQRSAEAPSAEHPAPSPGEARGAARQDTTPRVVLALMRALGDSVESVRRDAAYALGQREARAAIAPLGDRVLRDSSEDVREMSVWSLAQIGDRWAVTPIGRALLEDASSEVRAIAAWALGQFEESSSVTPLSAALLRDPSAEVRGRAAWALGQIQPRPAPPALVNALRDSVADVRYRAAWALGQIEDPETVPMLVHALRADSDRDTRRAMIWAIGQMDSDLAEGGLLAALEDPDPEVRAAAVRALAGGGSNPWPWPWPMPRVR